MTKRGSGRPVRARLNIHLPDAAIWPAVRTAAAKRNLTVFEYCLRAIAAQLVRDGKRAGGRAISAARRFQAQTLRGYTFTVISADLIRETRSCGLDDEQRRHFGLQVCDSLRRFMCQNVTLLR
jgi:hypothetical protein